MSDKPAKYRITTLEDMLAVPKESRANMAKDMLAFLEILEESRRLFAGIEGVSMETTMTFVDDKNPGVCSGININLTGKP